MNKVTIFFWKEDGTSVPIVISMSLNYMLTFKARSQGKKTQDILKEVFELFGVVNEINIASHLNVVLS